jgi:CheY-like chemotaxis protein
MLFQRFVQPSSASFSKEGGSGLGLYISKCLVELMGGTMHVESQRGKGSKFIFTFVVEKHSATSDNSSTQVPTTRFASRPVNGGTSDSSNLSPCTSPGAAVTAVEQQMRHVLVVDDNEINVRIFMKILERASGRSVSVTTASNGYDAIGKLLNLSRSQSPIDVILMDLDMPFMDGLKTAREIRSLSPNKGQPGKTYDWNSERLAAVPIIGLTADHREERFAEAKESGINDCITKPPKKCTLMQLIDKFVPPRAQSKDSPVQGK